MTFTDRFSNSSLADNLAVSAQGFRRGANRVRKVRSLSFSFNHSRRLIISAPYRICGTFFAELLWHE
jgi:hypothetical protein